jgi:hypothetical protein
MAISQYTHFEIRTTGNDNNGGGFFTGASGTDYSQQDAAQATLTTASVVNATTTKIDVDSGDYTCTDADVGNLIQIHGGTATAGFYQITARSAQQWTLDRSVGTAGQTVVANMGGALASPGKASFVNSTANGGAINLTFWIKSGTYTLTNSNYQTAGGPMQFPDNSYQVVEGYETTRGDMGEPPVINAGSATNIYLINHTVGNQSLFRNLVLDGNSQTGVNGFYAVYFATRVTRCTGRNFDASDTNHAFRNCNLDSCTSHDCGRGTEQVTRVLNHVAYNCVEGIYTFTGATAINCLIYNCTRGLRSNSTGSVSTWHNITVDNCSEYGVQMTVYGWLVNSIVSNCTTGVTNAASSALDDVAYYNNTTDNDQTVGTFYEPAQRTIQLVNDPYTSRSTGDFTLNDTAGGGPECLVKLGADGSTKSLGALPQVTSGGGGGSVYSLHPLAYN